MRARILVPALVLAALLGGCRDRDPAEGPPTDPVRMKALRHLEDGRSVVRITAMRELAPKATRFEALAIAKAAEHQDEEVRREAAVSLGKAPPAVTIDLLGTFLRDPSDGVREAAIEALGKKGDPKADALAAAAYEKGGPRTRAAISRARPAMLAKGLALEAAARKERVDEVLHTDTQKAFEKATAQHRVAGPPRRPDPEVKAAALEELGRSGTAEAVAELAARLVSDDPRLASAAALGLARAQAVDQIPALMLALGSKFPMVQDAAALAIGELGPQNAREALLKALSYDDPMLSSTVLSALDGLTLTATESAKVCEAAGRMGAATVAISLYRRAGPDCRPAPELPEDPGLVGQKWLVLAALGPKSPKLLEKARTDVTNDDALLAASAAAYLAIFGEPADGKLLRQAAEVELFAMKDGREREAAAAREAMAAEQDEHEAQRQQLERILALNGKTLPPEQQDRLKALLKRLKKSSDSLSREARTGSLEFEAATSAGAARLGGLDVAFGEELLASPQSRIQRLAVDVADLGGPDFEPLREKIRASDDAELRTAMLLRDAEAGRAGAFERLLAETRPPATLRADVMAALAKKPEAAKAVLLAAVEADDSGSAPAMRGLASVAGEDVDAALARQAMSGNASFALAAVEALGTRSGAAAERSLVDAAAHPDAVVREAALTALVKRKACGEAARLAPLAGDYEARVRSAARALAAACPPAPK